jgi:AraC-like DNA-binding protein
VKTQFIIPPPAISRYVSNILVIENDRHLHPDFVLPLFANGSPTLVFQTTTALKQDQSIGHLTLYGQTVKPDALSLQGDFTLIAYFFYPYTVRSLFGIMAHELTDNCVDLAFMQQSRTFSLKEQLLNLPSLPDRLQLLDRFIVQLSLSTYTDRKIVFATHEILQNNAPDALIKIQQELNISERTFQRLFEGHVGIAPRMFSRICQFKAAFQQLNHHRFSKLSDVAYDHGFADQSHFIRTFKEFTGLTPKEYLAKMAPYNPKF